MYESSQPWPADPLLPSSLLTGQALSMDPLLPPGV
jgi:hypothetical protein